MLGARGATIAEIGIERPEYCENERRPGVCVCVCTRRWEGVLRCVAGTECNELARLRAELAAAADVEAAAAAPDPDAASGRGASGDGDESRTRFLPLPEEGIDWKDEGAREVVEMRAPTRFHQAPNEYKPNIQATEKRTHRVVQALQTLSSAQCPPLNAEGSHPQSCLPCASQR